MRSPAALAEQALLLEVAATPTPGNVDRARDLPDLRFEQLLAGASGARPGLEALAGGAPVGEGFETAVEGMADAAGTNTQFGALLLLAPLVRAAADGDLSDADVAGVVAGTTVEDAAGFYRAFDHVDVRVDDPPDDVEALDVRRGSDAVPVVRERDLTLRGVMAVAADRDGIAREWVGGFERTFAGADRLAETTGPLGDRASALHFELLAAEPDTLVETKHGEAVAEEVRARAAEIDPADASAAKRFADELVSRGINPGTTADVLAGAIFVALVRGEVTP